MNAVKLVISPEIVVTDVDQEEIVWTIDVKVEIEEEVETEVNAEKGISIFN